MAANGSEVVGHVAAKGGEGGGHVAAMGSLKGRLWSAHCSLTGTVKRGREAGSNGYLPRGTKGGEVGRSGASGQGRYGEGRPRGQGRYGGEGVLRVELERPRGGATPAKQLGLVL